MAQRSWVLVHGAGGGAWEWAIWLRVLAARGIDARAIELVPRAPIEATRFSDYREQVRIAVRDASRRGAVVLVGASLGGLLAHAVAAQATLATQALDATPGLRADDRPPLAALVLVNPMPCAPHAAQLPRRTYPPLVPWGRDACLAGTRRAMPDADDATCLAAFRRWRDESGAVLDEAASGLVLDRPRCATLVLGATADDDVPIDLTRALARDLAATFVALDGATHVGPLLGRRAADTAALVARWVDAIASSPLPEPL